MSQTNQQIEYVAPSELEPHQLNREIYTNRDISELVSKIDRYGFQQEHELLATPEGKILSGHRRWRAALELGLDEVPVRRKRVEGGDDALLTLLLANQYRDKTPAEKIREGEAWEEIEREKAHERQSSGGSDKLRDGEKGKTSEKVGEKIGVSGRTYERGKEVKDKADAGDETAQEEWEKLESGDQSISGAHSAVKKSRNTSHSNGTDEQKSRSWQSGTVAEQSVEYRREESGSGYELTVGNEQYSVSSGLLTALLE